MKKSNAVMSRLSMAVLAATFTLSLAACDPTSRSQQDPGGTATEVDYGPAARLIEDLNSHLKLSLRCDIRDSHLTAGYAGNIPSQDAARCRFKSGLPLDILIVRNGKKTYRRYGRTFAPNHYLYGPTWFVIAPISTPQEALDTLHMMPAPE
jgi:hypothetical protein